YISGEFGIEGTAEATVVIVAARGAEIEPVKEGVHLRRDHWRQYFEVAGLDVALQREITIGRAQRRRTGIDRIDHIGVENIDHRFPAECQAQVARWQL